MSEQRPTGTTSYTYDFMDRMLSAGGVSYTYDRNGNQFTGGGRTLTYDLANRVRTLVQGSTTTTYSYDGDGKRLQASTGNQASAKTNFMWDTTTGLPELVLERNGNNALVRRYVNGLRPLFMSTSANSANYYHYDPLGSVRNVTNASGTTQLTYDYEPYGTIRTSSGTLANPVKFTGQYHDPTSLYHLRARQYDTTLGRFTAPDPLGPSGEPHPASAYTYAGSSPLSFDDPSGLTLRSRRVAIRMTGVATSGALGVRASGFGVPNLCVPGWSQCSQPQWVLEYIAEFVEATNQVLRAVAPYVRQCAVDGASGGLLASWSASGVVMGVAVGCGVGVLKTATRGNERINEVIEVLDDVDSAEEYNRGLQLRFGRPRVDVVRIVRIEMLSIRGNKAIRTRLLYYERIRR